MNILQINHYVGPREYCPAFRTTYLAKEWTKQGHQVTIVGASYSHMFIQFPSFMGKFKTEEEDGIRYIMFKTPTYHGNGIGRVWNMFAFVGQLFLHTKWLAREVKPDVVIACSVDVLDCIPAYRLAHRCAATFIREVRDLWPLTLVELGGISTLHPLVLLLQWAENLSYKRADRVITTLPHSLDHMRAHGLPDRKWTYIPQGVDLTEWQLNDASLPQLHRDALRRLRKDGRFIIGYAGSHGLSNSLHVLLEAANLLGQQSVAFVLVGQGPEKEALQRKAKELSLANVVFLPPIPKKSVSSLLAVVDATFIGWSRNSLYRFGISPNKIMDYMMACKPVIHAVEDTNDLVAESGCGISVAPENPMAISEAVRRLISMSPEERNLMGNRGGEYVRMCRDYRILAKQYLDVIICSATQQARK